MPANHRVCIMIMMSALLAASANAANIDIKSGGALGSYLVNGDGKPLYYFINDGTGNRASTCYGSCSDVWPPFYAEPISVGADLKAGDFGTIRREDVKRQITYKGWPLYLYSGDKKPGDTLGNNLDGLRFILSPKSFPPK